MRPALILRRPFFQSLCSALCLEENSVSVPFVFLRRLFPVALLLTLSCSAFAQPLPKPLPLHSPVQDKDFYLLSLLEANPEARSVLVADPTLSGIAAERQRFVMLEQRLCKGNAVCMLKAFLWTDEEIHTVSLALAGSYKEHPQIQKLVDRDLRSSGAYVIYQKQSGDILLANAWEICARGMNDVISVYGQGTAPRYPAIDSISFDVNSPDFQQHIAALVDQISAQTSETDPFFEPSLKAALQLLTLNHRDEAGRHEPMEAGVNEAAVKAISATKWGHFDYSVIVVPGAGPGNPNVALSDAGRKRIALAAEAWHAGKAPFILVSGGYVHPSQTRFSEAMEMKKALLSDYNVPEAAILVDPHARHTTTNMRNAAREIYRYGIPMSKPALMISDAAQTGYIAGQPFADRCLKELGYMPYKILSRPGDTSLVFLPTIESLEEDPMDPLDP
jgi:hypothetical protein